MAFEQLGAKSIGSIVKIKENGVPVDYLVVHQGQPSALYDASCNGTWLLRKDILDMRMWDGSEYRNDYANSQIHSFLNGEFYNRLDASTQSFIQQVKIPYRVGSGTDHNVNSGANGLSCKVFLLGAQELGFAGWLHGGIPNDSTKLSYFEQSTTASGEPSPTRVAYFNGAACIWWVRSPRCVAGSGVGSYKFVIQVYSSGTHTNQTANGVNGTRPAFVMPSHLYDLGDGRFTTNSPPGVPASINVPTSVSGGGTITVSWGAAGDAEGNLAGYQLERSVNGGGWGLIYQGGARTANDAITWGWNTVAYRVRAYDSANAFSGYQTGPTRSVFNNQPPAISGSDGSLGAKTGAFSTAYTVSDANSGQNVTVLETLDGAQKRAFNVTNSLACSFDVTAAEWRELANGTHTMKITATDAAGAAVARTLTFQKNETEIDVTAVLPQVPAAMPTKGILTVSRQIPLESNMLVEVCNNARDAAPTWQDITTAVKNGQKFFISNTQKTAAQWGIGIRVRVYRLGAAGECWISAIGGNFE